jgi:hypothetical protein
MAYEGRRLRERLGLPRPPGAGGDREAAAAAE